MANEQQMIDPDEVGRWEGDTFVLDEPLMIAGSLVNKISIAPDAELGEGITRDDAIHAMLNPIAEIIPADE